MVLELLAHPDYLRILHAVRHRPLRFSDLQKRLRLNPAQVDRALKFLRRELWVVPQVKPSAKGRLAVQYAIGRRGAAFLDSYEVFAQDVRRRQDELGADTVAEIESVRR
ncbi:MAG: ArsR family transcriptional regulator [Planctomycetes bacterium]|nr:ArsR family transcriptional regulator [Planctomycetota bacterium]